MPDLLGITFMNILFHGRLEKNIGLNNTFGILTMVIVRTANGLFLIVMVKLEEQTNSFNSTSHQIILSVKLQETCKSAFKDTIGQII